MSVAKKLKEGLHLPGGAAATTYQEKSQLKAQGHPPRGYPGHHTGEYSSPPTQKSQPCFLDTLLKKKENTEFKDIKILLFFDQSTPDLHIYQSPGLELII
jgi:hypothetical protein